MNRSTILTKTKQLSLVIFSTSTLMACNVGETSKSMSGTSRQNNLQYIDGKKFNELPQTEQMQEAAAATVGLIFVNDLGGKYACTGTVVKRSGSFVDILTAGHCLYDRVADKVKDYAYLNVYMSPDNESAGFDLDDFNMLLPSMYSAPRVTPLFTNFGSDVGIISIYDYGDKLARIKPFEKILHVTPHSYTAMLYSPDSVLYGFGWGSKMDFNFNSMPSSPKEVNYAMDDKRLNPLFTDDLKEISNPIKIVSYSEGRYMHNIEDPYYYTLKPKDELVDVSMSNTNVVELRNSMKGQPGDSGGPIFICNTAECNDVYLAGVSSTIQKGDILLRYVTTISPYLQEVMGI